MMKGEYDNYKMSSGSKRDAIPACPHEFKGGEDLITEYNPYLCDWVIKHGQDGFFIEGFCGRYNVSVDAMMKWLSSKVGEYEDFKAAVKVSISASLFYWNQELMHALKHIHIATENVGVIKGVLSDIMKATPKGLRELQFNNLHVKNSEDIENEAKAVINQEFLDAVENGE